MQHQELALGMMQCSGALGIYYQMGCGKTLIALMYIYERLQRKANLEALIVCPRNVVSGWWADIDKLAQFEGVTARGVEALKKAVTITTYQKLYKTGYKEVTRGGQKYSKKVRPLRPEVDRHWDILCVDESHSVGAHNSVQSKAVWEIAKQSDERFLFSGTPVHGGGGKSDYSKLYGQMRVLHPHDWMTWTAFCAKYVASINPRFHKIESYNIPACRKLMEDNAIVCRLEDCVDLPGFTDVEVDCPLAEKQVYRDVRDLDVERYGIDITTGGSPWIRLLQVCSGSLKRPEDTMRLKTSKDDQVEAILSSTEGKIVFFCNFTASIERVAELCRAQKRPFLTVDGRTKDKEAWRKFQDGPYDVIICQYMSGGAGLNLYAANYMVFYEPTPSALQYSQARGRIYRKGQDKKCIYYILSTPGTVEAKAWDAVRKGLSVTDRMLEEWAGEDTV